MRSTPGHSNGWISQTSTERKPTILMGSNGVDAVSEDVVAGSVALAEGVLEDC